LAVDGLANIRHDPAQAFIIPIAPDEFEQVEVAAGRHASKQSPPTISS
jgi:hypothetical protein